MKIISIGALWCPTCIIIKSRLKELQQGNSHLAIDFLDIDENPEIKEKYAVEDVPLIVVLGDEDNIIAKFQGATALDRLLAFIEK